MLGPQKHQMMMSDSLTSSEMSTGNIIKKDYYSIRRHHHHQLETLYEEQIFRSESIVRLKLFFVVADVDEEMA